MSRVVESPRAPRLSAPGGPPRLALRLIVLAAIPVLMAPGAASPQRPPVTRGRSPWARGDEAVPAPVPFPKDKGISLVYHTRRGLAWYARGDYGKAIADFDEAIRLDPTNASHYNNRAAARLGKGEDERAIADFTEAIRLDPSNAAAYYGRGLARHSRRDLDGAIADDDRAISLRPKFQRAYNNRGLVRHDKGEYDKAVADFNEAIRLDPEDAVAYNNRGNAREAKGEPDLALADYSEAIQLDPKYAKAYNNRGELRGPDRDPAGALADFDAAIHVNPDSARGYRGRARVLASSPDATYRDGKAAVAAATRACVLSNHGDPNDLAALAAAEAEAGDFASAERRQAEALKLIPEGDARREPFQARLDLYRAGKPFHEAPTGSPTR